MIRREAAPLLGGTGYMDIGQDSGETPLMTLVKRKMLTHERSNQRTMGGAPHQLQYFGVQVRETSDQSSLSVALCPSSGGKSRASLVAG